MAPVSKSHLCCCANGHDGCAQGPERNKCNVYRQWEQLPQRSNDAHSSVMIRSVYGYPCTCLKALVALTLARSERSNKGPVRLCNRCAALLICIKLGLVWLTSTVQTIGCPHHAQVVCRPRLPRSHLGTRDSANAASGPPDNKQRRALLRTRSITVHSIKAESRQYDGPFW